MNRTLRLLLASSMAAVAFAAGPQPVAPVEAASCISIYRIYYDSPGSDYGINSSLNSEWVQLRNSCSSGKSLTGWKIKDGYGWTYKFGAYTLAGASTVKVHTGSGSNTGAHRYWGRDWYVWNNTGDTANLINASGTRVDTCSFTDSGPAESVYC